MESTLKVSYSALNGEKFEISMPINETNFKALYLAAFAKYPQAGTLMQSKSLVLQGRFDEWSKSLNPTMGFPDFKDSLLQTRDITHIVQTFEKDIKDKVDSSFMLPFDQHYEKYLRIILEAAFSEWFETDFSSFIDKQERRVMGAKVIVNGLSNTKYNGLQGKIVTSVNEKGRYGVRLNKIGEVKSFKAQNLLPEIDEKQIEHWGFDLTNFEKGGFQKVLAVAGINEAGVRLQGHNASFAWRGEEVMITTACNPISGLYGRPWYRQREEDYASYIGISGTKQKVKEVVAAIHKHAEFIKDESPNERDFI